MALAAPISRNGFSFAGDSFSVTASGHVHRRCTMPELKAHFKTLGSAKDHPAHWYEAQLLHYGLPPSKVKGTAKMRLMEAVNAGKVTVPAPLGALEREMKKEWTALNKKAAAVAAPALKKTAGAKRKAAEVEVVTTTKTTGTSSVSVSVTVNTAGKKPAAKRAKTAAKPTTAAKATPTKTTSERKPTKADRTAATTTQTRVAKPTKPAAGKSRTPVRGSLAGTKTAPRGGYTWAAGDPAASSQDADPPTFPRKQTARRGNAAVGGRIKCEAGVKDEPPSGSLYDYPVAPPLSQRQSAAPALAPLGLINGRYELYSVDLSSRGSLLDEHCELVCTIDSDRLWVWFDFSSICGVMSRDARPRRSSLDPLAFHCRGGWGGSQVCDNLGPGWLAFVGDGFIDGTVDWEGQTLEFQARRIEGQSTRSETPAREMLLMWESFRPH
ncbi:hypothetical protein EsH8_V_000002 [Colletotrichum jinshuiense]